MSEGAGGLTASSRVVAALLMRLRLLQTLLHWVVDVHGVLVGRDQRFGGEVHVRVDAQTLCHLATMFSSTLGVDAMAGLFMSSTTGDCRTSTPAAVRAAAGELVKCSPGLAKRASTGTGVSGPGTGEGMAGVWATTGGVAAGGAVAGGAAAGAEGTEGVAAGGAVAGGAAAGADGTEGLAALVPVGPAGVSGSKPSP